MRLHLFLTAVVLASGSGGSYTPERVMVDVTNEFGACILKLLGLRGENVAFSPYGLVSVALVLYEGANGQTAGELHNSLRLPWDTSVTREGFRDLHRYLKSYFTNDGFLRGLVLSKPNVVLHRNYTNQLKFYGFDLRTEAPTMSPAETTPPVASSRRPTVVTTLMPVTTAVPPTVKTTINQKPDTTTNPANTYLTPKIDETTIMTTVTSTNVEGKDMEVELPAVVTTTSPEVTTPRTLDRNTEPNLTSPLVTFETTTSSTQESDTQPPEAGAGEGTTMEVSMVKTTVSMTVSETNPNLRPEPSTEAVPQPTELPTTTTRLTTESVSTPPTTITSETTVPTQGTAEVQVAAETDNVASESELVTRRERALYSKGNIAEVRESIPNWVPHYQDTRWRSPAPQETWFFAPSGGERVPTVTYTAYLPFAYISEVAALALQLPLDDPRYYMVVLLPEERDGLGKLLYALQWCSIRGIVNQLKITAIYATIPSFTIVKHINLVPALTKLGISRVFDPAQADLTAMSSEPGLYVRTVEQVVTVSLRKYFANHRWFDASPNDVEQHFIANHPFIYFVLDRETQVSLMTGTIVNPIAHSQ